jgi:anthranilate synthase component 1
LGVAHPLLITLPTTLLQDEFLGAVREAKEHIAAGDIFQLVLSQRFERRTFAEPFEVYRALRIVNPSPYMVYMQVGSQPAGFG